MATFDKRTDMTVRMDLGDLTSVSVQPSGYNPSLTLHMRDNQTLEINLAGEGMNHTFAFKNMLECIIEAAISCDWTQRYGSGHAYTGQGRKVTIHQIMEWAERARVEAEVAETLKAID